VVIKYDIYDLKRLVKIKTPSQLISSVSKS